jgi:hypothetical protein
VELALSLPVVLFIAIGLTEMGFLLIAKADQDHRTVVVAEWAASHPGESWNSVANYELPGCDVTATSPRPDLLEMKATCQYHPIVLVMWNGLPISSRAQAASEFSRGSPSPTPDASPSSSSTTRRASRLS